MNSTTQLVQQKRTLPPRIRFLVFVAGSALGPIKIAILTQQHSLQLAQVDIIMNPHTDRPL